MKKVVERVQRENEALKKSSIHPNQSRVAALEKENEKLKVIILFIFHFTFICVLFLQMKEFLFFFQADYEKLKHQSEAELGAKLEAKTKGLEKIAMENERLRKEIKRVARMHSLI